MDKKTLIETAKAMVAAPNCYAGLKEKGQAWIDSVGKADEKAKAEALLAEIEGDVTDIDHLVGFAHSPKAKEIFGEEGAKKFAAHADELKASGAKFCDCAACKPAKEILDNKTVLLA